MLNAEEWSITSANEFLERESENRLTSLCSIRLAREKQDIEYS